MTTNSKPKKALLRNDNFGLNKTAAIAIPRYADEHLAQSAQGLSKIQKQRVGY
jgi:hypothetical protein